jgi:hypothetical protein
MKSIKRRGDSEIEQVCINCASYYVTWAPRHPHGCKAFGFKSAQVPSAVVSSVSEDQCLKFSVKPRLERRSK